LTVDYDASTITVMLVLGRKDVRALLDLDGLIAALGVAMLI
jgi:hypothetical protein